MADNSRYDRKKNNSTDYEHPQESNLLDLHKAMEYNKEGFPVVRTVDESPTYTSKGRQRVSNSNIIFFSSFQFDKDDEVWDEEITADGISIFDPDLSNIVAQVGSSPGSEIIRQTKRVIPYIPSRQNNASLAFRFEEGVEGVRRRVGIFDELNGMYLEQYGTELAVVIRRETNSGIFEDRKVQSEWNLDKLDGSDLSQISLDLSKQQLVSIEYDWYGSGDVTFKMLINNRLIPIHIFNHANVLERTWIRTPYLPLRFEVTNVTGASGAHSMILASTSVIAEGDIDIIGKERGVQTNIEGTVIENAFEYVPVLSLRLREDRLNAVATLKNFQILDLANQSTVFYEWSTSPDLSGPTWQTVPGVPSAIEFDINASAADFGLSIIRGAVSPGGNALKIPFGDDFSRQFGREGMGTTPIIITLSVAVQVPETKIYTDVSWTETR